MEQKEPILSWSCVCRHTQDTGQWFKEKEKERTGSLWLPKYEVVSCNFGLRYCCHWGTKHNCSWLEYKLFITPRSISSLLIQFYLLLQEVFLKDPVHRVVYPLSFLMALLLCKAETRSRDAEKGLELYGRICMTQLQFWKNKSRFGVGFFSSVAVHLIQRLYGCHSWICSFRGERGKETRPA